jgi:dTDP-4-amino-4,6-dideoxygalactose transaminase
VTVPSTDIPQQYLQFKNEFDGAISRVLQSGIFIGGNEVVSFENQLSAYLHINHVVACANGTDALQLALMALDLPRGSKIIVPAFTYIAPVEVIKLMGYEPIYCDVDERTFNCTLENIAQVYSSDVKAIVPVHLFGQHCKMNEIVAWAEKNNVFIIEDNAQSIASEKDLSGTHSVFTTSFFPTKNLSCYGDGGAVLTNDTALAEKIRQLANHGQLNKKYFHDIIGINSRLDAIQAVVLQIKLNHLDSFILKRQKIAAFYNEALQEISTIQIPKKFSSHTYHQYTIQIDEKYRDGLQQFLLGKNIPVSVYYPVPAYLQQAYLKQNIHLPNTEKLCKKALSLPMHTDLDETTLSYICNTIQSYFKK